MRYNVAQLLRGPTGALRRYDLCQDIRHLDPELEPIEPLVGQITLMRTSQGVLVVGRVRTTLRVTCRRCLEPFDMEVEFDLEEEFHPVVRLAESPVDKVPAEDWDEALLIDEHHVLDMGEVVRQALWLVGPMDAVCRPDCEGLCPECGGNRNLGECHCDPSAVDPRWAALQELLTKQTDFEKGSE